MFILGIVGTSRELSPAERSRAEAVIDEYCRKLRPYRILSGGATGIDSIVRNYISLYGEYRFSEYFPTSQDWKGYRARNKRIAENSDAILCITTHTKTRWCYHHSPWQNHEKTAGCWTANYASSLDKPIFLEII